jgi:hypothetical protein
MVKKPKRNVWGLTPEEEARSAAVLREDELMLLNVWLFLSPRHGEKKARKMLANYMREPDTDHLGEYERYATLAEYDTMQPRPNITKLAREKAGSLEGVDAVVRKFRRWKRERRTRTDVLFSNTSPPLKPGEPAEFVLIPTKRR